jgi:hypothetical protein
MRTAMSVSALFAIALMLAWIDGREAHMPHRPAGAAEPREVEEGSGRVVASPPAGGRIPSATGPCSTPRTAEPREVEEGSGRVVAGIRPSVEREAVNGLRPPAGGRIPSATGPCSTPRTADPIALFAGGDSLHSGGRAYRQARGGLQR